MKRGTIAEAARFAGVQPQYAGRVAHEQQAWQNARPSLVRALYAAGWAPKEGRRAVRAWLTKEVEKISPTGS